MEVAFPAVEPLVKAPAGFSAADFFPMAFGGKADLAEIDSTEPAPGAGEAPAVMVTDAAAEPPRTEQV